MPIMAPVVVTTTKSRPLCLLTSPIRYPTCTVNSAIREVSKWMSNLKSIGVKTNRCDITSCLRFIEYNCLWKKLSTRVTFTNSTKFCSLGSSFSKAVTLMRCRFFFLLIFLSLVDTKTKRYCSMGEEIVEIVGKVCVLWGGHRRKLQ